MSEKIACLVRGGEAGRRVQEYSIAYARENHKHIVFIHVVDTGSLSITNEALETPAREELTWLGQVKLSTARRRAEAAGVKAETAILYGTIFEAVRDYLLASPVELVLMGAPHPAVENYEQRLEHIQQFAARMSEATQVPTKVV